MKKRQMPQNEVSWTEVFAFVRWYLLGKWAECMTFLTKYEPFSLLSDNFIFHYNNRKMHRVRDAIWEKYHVASGLADKDEHFFYMYFNKKRIALDALKDTLKNTDVLVSEHEGYVKIVIPRE